MTDEQQARPRKEPTEAQERRWFKRAETIRKKAAALFDDVERTLGPDHELISLVGDTMCSAHELSNSLDIDGERQ